MNWADLSSVLIIIACSTASFGGMAKKGVTAGILAVVAGFLVGLGTAMLSSKCAYSILDSQKLPIGLAMPLYLFVPLVLLFVGVFGAAAAAWAVTSFLL
jgi:hypothetical protein